MSIDFKFNQEEFTEFVEFVDTFVDTIEFFKIQIIRSKLNIYPLSIPEIPDYIDEETKDSIVNTFKEFNEELAKKFYVNYISNMFIGELGTQEKIIEIEYIIKDRLNRMKNEINCNLNEILKGKLGFKKFKYKYLKFKDWDLNDSQEEYLQFKDFKF